MDNDIRKIGKRGFTLVEMIVVLALLVIVLAIAIPSITEMRQNIQFRSEASNLAKFIRVSRSAAISNNREQRVELNLLNRTYLSRPGERAINSAWANAANQQAAIVAPVIGIASIGGVQTATTYNFVTCRPNGTMLFSGNPLPAVTDTAIRITLFDNRVAANATQNSQRYRIDINQTGRIVVRKVGVNDVYP